MGFLAPAFRRLCPDVDLQIGSDAPGLERAEVAVCWDPPAGALASLPRLRLVQSIAAGVDHILSDRVWPVGVALCRVVDPGMAAGMSAYVSWAVIHRQRHFDRFVASAAKRQWQEQPIVSPKRHRVAIAGLGWLGAACARSLATIGYDVRGWTRSGRRPPPIGVASFHGPEQLADFLSGADTLVCLLPLTPETHGFLSAAVFAQLPPAAHVVNVGRGAHLVEADLMAALASGQVGAATLDTFAREPLPLDHPFWSDPRILITPHCASRTDIGMIARQTLDNLALVRQGKRPPAAVDPARGY